MKRMLALALCLVMVLGLFTCIAAAENPENLIVYMQTGPSSFAPYDRLNTGPFSSFGFNAYTGTTATPVRIENATFSLVDADGNPTDKLGELHEDYDNQWDCVFSTENAWPNTTGYLRATVGETVYQMPVSVGGTEVMVYSNADCTEYLPPNNRTLNCSESQSCYIAIESALIGTGNATVSDSRFTLGAPVEKQIADISYNIYCLTAPENFSGTCAVSVTCTGLEDWAIPTITFTDGRILSTCWDNGNPTDDGMVTACGDWGMRMYYGMDKKPVPADAGVYFQDSEGNRSSQFGTISYNPNDGRWCWIRDSAIPGATGTMVAEINDVKYTRSVTMIAPELSFGTYVDPESPDPTEPEYIPYDSLSFQYDGTNPICYVAATMNWIETVKLSDNTNFQLISMGEGSNLYIISAKEEGLTGTYVVELIASNANGNHYECEITLTDGKNLTLLGDDGRVMDTTQITPIGNEGINLTYGLDNTPVPSDAAIVLKDSNGNPTNTLGTISYDPGSENYGSWTWRWDRNSVIPGASGSMEVTVEGVTYSCQVNFIMPALAFFSQEDCSLASYIPFSDLWELTYSSENMPNLYIQTFYDWHINSYEANNSNFIIEEIPGKHVLRLKQGATGEQLGDIQFHLTDGDSGNNYYGMGLRFINRGSLAREKAAVTQWTDRKPDDNRSDIASVTYQGNTYYLVLTNQTDGTIVMNPMRSTGLGLDDQVICDYYVDFCTWSNDLNKYQRVDAELSETLFDRFINGSETGPSALVFEILPINYTFLDSDEYTKPTYTPAVYYGPENWPISYQAVYDRDCGGEFLVRISGFYTNDDGTTKFCETYATEGIYPIVHDEVSFTTIAEAQDYLDDYRQNTASDMLAIRFNVEELEGHLVIPDNLHNVALHGGYTDEDGEWQQTIWCGGVSSGADFGTQLQFFHFIGAGGQNADIDDIPEYWPGTNIPNYAIYGPANGVPHHCTIEGYYHGMHMDQNSTAVHFGGESTTYYRNVTAVYMDITPNSGGWLGNMDCTFEENGTALNFVDYPDPTEDFFPIGDTEIVNAKFINNNVDVRNTTGQILWMPMNYFVHDNQVDQGNDINNAEKKRTPVLEGFITSKNKEIESTIPYPMAWDETFNKEQYYYPRSYTTKNALAEMYPYVSFKERSQEMQRVMLLSDEGIENTEDTVTITSVSGDEWTASMEITSPAEAESPAVYSRRMMMRSAPSRMVYSMVRVEQEGGIVALGLPAISKPSTGKAQTWVDESWVNVEVKTGSDETVSASVSNGIVTFDLLPGYYDGADGTRAFYFIRPTATAKTEANHGSITVTVTGEPDKGNTFTVDVPDDWKDSIIIVTDPDGEETEYEVSEDGSVTFPADKTGKYTLKEKKSGLSGLLGILAGAGSSSVSFTDVVKGAWFYNDVAWAYDKGLMNGTGEGRFSPNAATSRAMIVTILWRLEGSPMGMEASSFSDVNRNSWYGYAVDWAAAFGIVEGYDGKFAPNDSITREQLAAILYRYAKYKGYDVVNTQTNLDNFTDADKVSDWAAEPMKWAAGAGLITGSNEQLMPQNSATRTQTAAMLHRFFG